MRAIITITTIIIIFQIAMKYYIKKYLIRRKQITFK